MMAGLDYKSLLALALATVCLLVLVWALFKLWSKKFGRRSVLLNTRINALSQKLDANASAVSIFKEATFSKNSDINDLLAKFPWAHKLNNLILGAGYTYTVHEFLIVEVAVFVAAFFAVGIHYESLVGGFFAGILFLGSPVAVLSVQNAKRRATIEKQLPDFLDFIGRSLSAGHSFVASMQTAVMHSPEPIAAEFKMTYEQLNFGIPIKDVMGDLVKRLQLDEVRFFAIAVVINREVGGNLAELLSDVSVLIRQRLTSKLVIQALTSEGRATAKLLTALPVVIALLIELFNPGYFAPVLSTSFGVKLYLATGVWVAVGFIWMRMMSNIKM